MKIDVSEAVAEIVEAILPRFSKQFLHVCISAHYDCYEKKEEIHKRAALHFFFHRPNNYTKVFFAERENGLFGIFEQPLAAKLVSDHDSCWKSDGVEYEIYRVHCRMMRELEEQECKAIEFCRIQKIKIYDGELFVPHCADRDNRNYEITISDNKIRIEQVKL